MSTMINTEFGSCWTLAFKNISLGDQLFVWVCADREVYDRRLKQLESMPHVTIVQAGAGIVKDN